jgi:hypothetical protein
MQFCADSRLAAYGDGGLEMWDAVGTLLTGSKNSILQENVRIRGSRRANKNVSCRSFSRASKGVMANKANK